MIASALSETQAWLGLPREPERWLGSLYQSANRLAHLYFLRERAGVDAWLVHVCFFDDVAHVSVSRPDWEKAIEIAELELGLAEASPYAGAAFLPARPATELVNPQLPERA